MKQLHCWLFQCWCGLGLNKNSSTHIGNREDWAELIILVNALDFFLPRALSRSGRLFWNRLN